jgi:hypothetical protein
MGIFYPQVEVFNRAPDEVSIIFDGQEITLKPLTVTLVPKVAVGYGKNQNPIMGSVNPNDPTMEGGQYLIGIVGEDPVEPLTKDEWEVHKNRPCRMDELAAFEEVYGRDPRAKILVHGKGRKTTALNRTEAGVDRGTGIASFSAKE